MAPGQKANDDNLRKSFLSSMQLWFVEYTHQNHSNEYTQHTISRKNKFKKKSLYICFWSYRKNFLGTQKRNRISHGKGIIGVRVIEALLYFVF